MNMPATVRGDVDGIRDRASPAAKVRAPSRPRELIYFGQALLAE
jgi:hypothetical protein